MTRPATARLYRGTPRNLARLARMLRDGELVAVPTETVYGLAANALDARACRKIFRAKGRPANDPLIVHIHDRAQLDLLAETNSAAERLARAFWPGPLTMVLPRRSIVPAVVSSGLPSVAVRMPAHPLFRQLLRRAGMPVAAPSANPFGYISPTSAAHVRAGLGRRIPAILDGGECPIGVESTIVDLRDPRHPQLLRPGAVSRRELESVLGVRVRMPTRRTAPHAPISPGLLSRHYSPRTPSQLHERFSAREVGDSRVDEAWIFVARPAGVSGENIFWLSERGSLREAARRLFHTLRLVDAQRFKRLHFERARGGGLADAINDRLARAAGRG
ncbi:L-threonylcarbamoyladenylate synthase [Opitutus terrae]|uniref:Threonylcarbamoyl-AMP synthase n=1 Tax=Opitutus terrae (strain DSM 11246 / JCM 15787 / PB90-1) TaxID=452637 RepID=B1ZTU9_OPITP|nr:L-threonylcarbamoyladenylate synthase [Opitutus terrae]ACB74882.1 Sua5/YciO/YrdC/YwlC family protein [Opitutus terrae PB90-1]